MEDPSELTLNQPSGGGDQLMKDTLDFGVGVFKSTKSSQALMSLVNLGSETEKEELKTILLREVHRAQHI